MKCGQYKLVILLLAALVSACGVEPQESQRPTSISGLNSDSDSVQLAPLLQIEEAKGFALVYREGHRVLQLFAPGAGEQKIVASEYLLLPKSSNTLQTLSPEMAAMSTIMLPVQRIITSSTTHISLLAALESEQVLVAHADDLVWNDTISTGLDLEQIAQVGASINLNVELVVDLEPDLYMAVASSGAKPNSYAIMAGAGIPIIENAEYLETTVLGRAEWIKFMGVLLGKEEQATTLFSTVKTHYNALNELTAQVTNKPDIFLNTPYRGTWFVPGGDGYMAQLIADAGGDYYWGNTAGSSSIVVAFEEMIAHGLQADIWLNPSVNSGALAEVGRIDSRLVELKPFQNGEVYAYSKRIASNGANDYWESGIVYPDRILADLIKIFHPQLLPDYDLFYYQQLQ